MHLGVGDAMTHFGEHDVAPTSLPAVDEPQMPLELS
jgi:hypothetical protein